MTAAATYIEAQHILAGSKNAVASRSQTLPSTWLQWGNSHHKNGEILAAHAPHKGGPPPEARPGFVRCGWLSIRCNWIANPSIDAVNGDLKQEG